jgi:sulfide:quinone oxidoreductase
MKDNTSRIVILGASFGALTAVRELRKRAPRARITVVSIKPEFVYYPSLIWIPTGLRKSSELVLSLDTFFKDHAVEFIQARVTGLDNGGRTVLTDHGPIQNDALIIATGGRYIKKLPGIDHAITLCEGIAAAEAIKERLATMKSGHIALGFGGNPNEPAAMRGGPMFELMFGIDTWLRKQGKRDKIGMTFFNAAAQPGKRLGEKAVTGLLSEMKKRGINTHLGHKPVSFSDTGVKTEGGEISANLILFMPGLTGPVWAPESGLPLSSGGFIQGDEYCQVPGTDKVYVVGDAGSFPGPDWLPKQGHMADLQAKAASQNLLLALNGQKPKAKPRPELVCIVDTLDAGILVYRDLNKSWILPPSILFHWAKRLFESHYLRVFRR